MNQQEERKALIRKYLNGECSAIELAELKQLMLLNDLSDLFNEVMDELSVAADKISVEPDVDAALLKFKTNLPQNNTFESGDSLKMPAANKKINYKYFYYAAAILLVFSFVSIFSLRSLNPTQQNVTIAYEEVSNPNGIKSKILLPDSSIVYLGAGSKLSFPSKFSSLKREISLVGEAFFEVTKNPKKPFIIHTQNIVTQVLGTSFKVDAFPGKPVSVLVSTGKVRVDRELNNRLQAIAVLLPGEMVTWDEKLQRKDLRDVSIKDISDWKNGKLVFRKTRLDEITQILERWYNVDIQINKKSIAEQQIRVNLTVDIPLDKLIKILSVAGNFKYRINDNQVYIF
jgi:transmembrane sensor